MWIRALLLCDDVRLELGGTTTLVGVRSERLVVEPANDGEASRDPGEPEPEIQIARLAIYAAVAGLTGRDSLAFRVTLRFDGAAGEALITEGDERHDPTVDEHRLIHFAAPLALPGAGRYQLALALRDGAGEHRVVHEFTVERAAG